VEVRQFRLSQSDAAIEDTVRELSLEALKPKQRDAIQSFLAGNDCVTNWLLKVSVYHIRSTSIAHKYAFFSLSFSKEFTDDPGHLVKIRRFKISSSLEQLLAFPAVSPRTVGDTEAVNTVHKIPYIHYSNVGADDVRTVRVGQHYIAAK